MGFGDYIEMIDGVLLSRITDVENPVGRRDAEGVVYAVYDLVFWIRRVGGGQISSVYAC